VASLPAFLNALPGKGVHITTVNDYLARRDAEWIGPIYRALGLEVGALQMQMPDQERQKQYRCDITYGMASEFGFDFLRDRLKVAGDRGQGSPFWSGVDHRQWHIRAAGGSTHPARTQLCHRDEADSIFIDEARTPLIISAPHAPGLDGGAGCLQVGGRPGRQDGPQPALHPR